MFKKVVRRLKNTLHNLAVIEFQEQIALLLNIKNKGTAEKFYDILKKYSTYLKLKFVEVLDFRNNYPENSNSENIYLKRLCFWNTNSKNSSLKGACLYETTLQNLILAGNNFKNVMLYEENPGF